MCQKQNTKKTLIPLLVVGIGILAIGCGGDKEESPNPAMSQDAGSGDGSVSGNNQKLSVGIAPWWQFLAGVGSPDPGTGWPTASWGYLEKGVSLTWDPSWQVAAFNAVRKDERGSDVEWVVTGNCSNIQVNYHIFTNTLPASCRPSCPPGGAPNIICNSINQVRSASTVSGSC